MQNTLRSDARYIFHGIKKQKTPDTEMGDPGSVTVTGGLPPQYNKVNKSLH
jgi:hypothetical protein